MRRLICVGLTVIATGCATGPGAPPTVDTGTIVGDVGDARNRAKVHTELASLYIGRGRMGIALEELRTAQTADPGYAPVYSMFGLVYAELRESALAESSFQRGLQIAPDDPDINHNYGWFLCQTARETEAVRYFLRAIQNPLYRSPWRSYGAAGVCAMRKNNLKDAEDYFQRALKLYADEPASLLSMGKIRYRQEKFEEARKFVRRFNKLVSPNADSLWLALRVERKLGERVAEAGLANQLRRRFPGSREYQSLQRGEFD